MLVEYKDPQKALLLYKAMYHFQVIRETRDIAEWLESELARLDKANRIEESDIVFRQRQGACQVLTEFLSMMKDAKTKVEKLMKTGG